MLQPERRGLILISYPLHTLLEIISISEMGRQFPMGESPSHQGIEAINWKLSIAAIVPCSC